LPQSSGLKIKNRRITSSILEVFFELLYSQFAWGYDLVSQVVSLGLWKSWIFSTLPFLHGNKILEIGHGPGHLQIAISKLNSDVYGLDSSIYMGRLAKKNLIKSGFSRKLVQANSQFIPFLDESFDQIVSTFPSDFIYNDFTLQELFRVLRQEGELIVLPVAWITEVKCYYRLADWLFKVAGQSPMIDDTWLIPFEKNGFTAEILVVRSVSSELALIIAKKAAIKSSVPYKIQD